MTEEERVFTALLRLVESGLDADPESRVYTDPRLARWLVYDLELSRTAEERAMTRRRARGFERSMEPVLAAARAERRVMRVASKRRPAPETAPPRVLLNDVRTKGHAPLVDLSVAAGVGRELWDEPSDTLVELPHDAPPGEYVALRVSGDSMTPFVTHGDTLLVRVGRAVQVEDIVIVRLPDSGYVVKSVTCVTPTRIRLLSFNPEHQPLWVEREHASVLGTVIARITTP